MMNPDVDAFLKKAPRWAEEMKRLCQIVREEGLEEEFKWKAPCYCLNGANVVMVGSFKDSCSLSFFKGSLLADTKGLLVAAGPNSRHARLMRFTTLADIEQNVQAIRRFLKLARQIEEKGLKVATGSVVHSVPEELSRAFSRSQELKEAFSGLTPGRQRAWLLHFSGARQSGSRESRIQKATPRILKGLGPQDCFCGKSKRMPRCDGSHSKP